MNKKIMILGAGILQVPAIKMAKKLGFDVVAVDMNPNAIGFEEGITKEVISTIDIPKVLSAAEKHKIDGIMTLASDMPMRTVAVVAKKLGLVGVSEETAVKATDKAVMRQCLKEYGVPVPNFFKVTDINEYKSAVSCINGSFVVKPADNSGSRGIILVADKSNEELLKHAYEYSYKNSRNGVVVVEEYMRGPEVSVETLTVDGKCTVIQITDKLTTGAPHFVEMGHSQPTALPYNFSKQIKEIAIAANKAVGITNGPSHTEIIVTEDGPKIVELGARLGGDCITTHLVPLSTGVNMVECCIRIALGEKPDIEQKINAGSAIRYFKHKAGIIQSISGVDNAEKISGIKQISFVAGVGDKVGIIDSSASRLGFVIAQGENATDAISVCEQAIEKIKITIE